MTPHDPRDPFEGDDDLLAAEYALGVLDANRRREAAVRTEAEPAFAMEVARWEERFAPWLDAIAPVPASAAVWERVRDTLWTEAAPRPSATPLWQRLGFWRGVAVGSTGLAAAAVATIFMLARHLPPPAVPAPIVAPAQLVVVSLRHEDGSTAYTGTLDPATGRLILVPVQLQGDVATSPELWLIPAGERPRSLGMIARDRAMTVTIPAALRASVRADSLFAISLEPAGSGPHAQPTGPVVAKGSPKQI